MTETEKAKATNRQTRPKKQTTAKVKQDTQPKVAQPQRSVSFQIRTTPGTKELAERVASDHNIGGRSKLDADIYKRGLLLTMLLLGSGPDGSYSGQSERDIARQLEPFFDRLYAVLDKHQLLASYVYRVLPPGGMGGIAFLPQERATSVAHIQEQQTRGDSNQDPYRLSDDAQTSLANFAEEI